METIATPALIVDEIVLQKNAQKMLTKASLRGVSLRPHIKTHKTVEGAFYQLFGDDKIAERSARLESSMCKITVSTLGEAEFYANAGFQDILYAVPLSINKLQKAFEISKMIKHFHIMFDHPQHLVDAEIFWKANTNPECPWKWSVFLQIDSGGHRCGVEWNDPASIQFALDILQSPAVNLTGIYTHAGHSYKQSNEKELHSVTNLEQQCVEEFAESLVKQMRFSDEQEEEIFVKNLILSIGSTPSLSFEGEYEDNENQIRVTEYHPGNYIFYDQMQAEIGSCSIEDCSAYVLASVISHYPHRNELLIDCGALALSKDSGLAIKLKSVRPDNEFSWGYIKEEPKLRITSITQELGVVQVPENIPLSSFPIGSKLSIIPHHSCLTAACFPQCYVIKQDENMVVWPTCPRKW